MARPALACAPMTIAPPILPVDAPPPWLVQAVGATVPIEGPWLPLEGGRSNRVWRAGDLAVKLYDPTSATPLFPNEPAAEALALQSLTSLPLAPSFVSSGAGWLAYRYQPGASWRQDPAAVARLLGELHGLGPLPGLRSLPVGPQQIGQQARSFAMAGLPPMPKLSDPGPVRPTIVHGDAVPGNIVVTPQGLRLIDWQCPGNGDPVDDLALFLSPAMQLLYRGAPLSLAEREAFLAAYPCRATVARYVLLAPLLHWRIAAHCAFRAARGDDVYGAAIQLELG